jgi:DNA polymerase III subunit delta
MLPFNLEHRAHQASAGRKNSDRPGNRESRSEGAGLGGRLAIKLGRLHEPAMSELKASGVDAYLRKPPSHAIILVYGPDRGLVSERASLLARQSGTALDDPFSSVRLDAAEIEADPPRLADEAGTISMFGGKRLIWVQGAGGPKFAAAFTALCDNPPPGALILVEAGELKKEAALRKAAEKSPSAVTLPCYPDEGRGIDALIDEVMAANALQLDMDARQFLRARLGGDRLASRGELEKLALYARGARRVTLEDARQSIGDASAASVDAVVDGVISGDLDATDAAFAKLAAGKLPVSLVLQALVRQLQTLLPLRDAVERGGRAADIIAAMRPPLWGSRKATVEKGLARWPMASIIRALARLADVTLEARQRNVLEDDIIRQALLGLAVEARRNSDGRGAR